MDSLTSILPGLTGGPRIVLIAILAVATHLAVMTLRRGGTALLTSGAGGSSAFAVRRPKLASITSILVSAATFGIYFGALGLILAELGISLTAYFASATVIGLAVGFGSQGLVQDIVIGLTLIFSDVLDVGDVADIGGQTGRVEAIGLRFTVLRTLVDQQVFTPNRNVSQINRYRNGYVRVYADLQLPEGTARDALEDELLAIAEGMHAQHPDIVLSPPDSLGVRTVKSAGWSYLRIKFKIWPGQAPLIESTFRQRALAAIRKRVEEYPDWMVVVTYRARE